MSFLHERDFELNLSGKDEPALDLEPIKARLSLLTSLGIGQPIPEGLPRVLLAEDLSYCIAEIERLRATPATPRQELLRILRDDADLRAGLARHGIDPDTLGKPR